MKTNVMRILDKEHVPYTPLMHTRAVYTSEEAAAERGVRVSQIVKTMLVKSASGDCFAALIRGDCKLDLKALRSVLGGGKVEFVAREDVRKVTGYEPGAVSPVGMLHVKKIIADAGLLQEETVTMSSGSPEAGLAIQTRELLRLLNAQIAQIAVAVEDGGAK